ncbi:MAG TPA: DUF2804 family protein [Solirubrobacteraceae bacterium]|nr:DUF2804 family protein [Solirubrobacteraceae bacterium]
MPLHKRWTWVGAFGPELMLCAAVARVGPARSAWWAVWDGARLHERTFHRLGPVTATPSRVAVRGILDLSVACGAPWECTTGPAWTRKSPALLRGTVLGRAVELRGLVDESGGRHARETAWWWSCGVGALADGREATWNLVDGLHDGVEASERCVWVDGVPSHVPPQPFRGFEGVGGLDFDAVATRARREDYGVLMSDYEAPFGRFSGALPVGELREGFGVMERHRARW